VYRKLVIERGHNMSNQDIVKKFKRSLISKDMAEATIDNYMSMANKAVELVDSPISEWTITDLEEVSMYLIEKGYENTSYNKNLTSFKIFIKWLITRKVNLKIDLVVLNDEFKLKRVNNKKKRGEKAMPSDEFGDFVKFVLGFGNSKTAQRSRVIVLIEVMTGLRRVETQKLKREDIDFKNKSISPSTTKFDKEREVGVQQFVLDEIEKLYTMFPDSEYVFVTETGKNIAITQINRSVNYFVKKAMQKDVISERVTPHGLRKSYATWLYREKRIPIQDISEILGHEDIATTQIYLSVDTKAVSRTMSELDVFGDEGREDEESNI